MSDVRDDLATLRQSVRFSNAQPRLSVSWECNAALDRVEDEITRLEREREWWTAVNKELLPYQERAVAAEAEIARLRDGLLEAKWLIGAGLPHTMEWHDRADAWYTEARALLAEDGAV